MRTQRTGAVCVSAAQAEVHAAVHICFVPKGGVPRRAAVCAAEATVRVSAALCCVALVCIGKAGDASTRGCELIEGRRDPELLTAMSA